MKDIRRKFLFVLMALVCLGIVMIFSASSVYCWDKYKDSLYFLKRHMIAVGFGLLGFLGALSIDYRLFQKHSRRILLVSFILLALVLVIGREVSGAKRWFRLGGMSFQPSELFSMAMIFYMADYIARKERMIRDYWWGFIPAGLILGLGVLMILAQPDLGTSLSVCVVSFIMLLVGGLRPAYLGWLFLGSLPVLYFLIFSVPYRRMRILGFLDPWADPMGKGFQLIQSQIALGSGGLFGVGLGHSKQKLFYLPAAHTDFIFSIIGEELGLLGTIVVIALFCMFLLYGLKIIKNTKEKFDYFLGIGLLSMIALKTVVNIGVSCGVLPTKGLPLPFISYGGSSFIIDMISAGLLLNISFRQDNPDKTLAS